MLNSAHNPMPPNLEEKERKHSDNCSLYCKNRSSNAMGHSCSDCKPHSETCKSAPSPKESKGWEENVIVSDFDDWYDSYSESGGHPPKSSVLGYLIRTKNKALEEQRKEILDNFKALSDGKPIYYIQHSDKWSHWRCVCGRQNSDDALEKQRRDSLKKPQNHH